MKHKLNRSCNHLGALAVGWVLLILWIAGGSDHGLEVFAREPLDRAGGSDARAGHSAPKPNTPDLSKQKAAENTKEVDKRPSKPKRSKRRLLMARFSPTAIFADGLPAPEKPLEPDGLALAQTLRLRRAAKPLKLYSRLLYYGARLSRLDGVRFEADGQVFTGKGVPPDHFLLFRGSLTAVPPMCSPLVLSFAATHWPKRRNLPGCM